MRMSTGWWNWVLGTQNTCRLGESCASTVQLQVMCAGLQCITVTGDLFLRVVCLYGWLRMHLVAAVQCWLGLLPYGPQSNKFV